MAFLISSLEFVPSDLTYRRNDFPATILSKPLQRNVSCFYNLRPSCYDGVKVRVRPRVNDLKQNMCLLPQFSFLLMQGSSAKETGEEKLNKNYHVDTGYAIRTLREDIPALFTKELNFAIYREDIVFKDPVYTFMGISQYKAIFWALRLQGKLFFKSLVVDIIRIWQPLESAIVVRWSVHGTPRVPWDSRGRFDGISEYKLDKNGKIYEHRVHNIAPTPKFHVLSVDELILSVSCPSTPKPTYYEIKTSLLPVNRLGKRDM